MKQNNNNEADFYIYWHRKTHWLKKKTLEIIEHVQNDPTFSKKKKKLHNTENECMCALVFIHKY